MAVCIRSLEIVMQMERLVRLGISSWAISGVVACGSSDPLQLAFAELLNCGLAIRG